MYLIIGANGFVGSYAIKNILEKTDDKIIAADMCLEDVSESSRVHWIKCDITKHEDIVALNEIMKKECDVKIIYLAAMHHPDKVREFPRVAWNINITCLSDFLNTMENVKCLFFASTEMVFPAGNRSVKFDENYRKDPVNIYGKHKVVCESMVTAYGYNVVRFPFMIGPSILKHKKHFYDIIVETIQRGEKMEMFEDAIKAPLDFNTAIGTVVDLAEAYTEDMPKILNIAGDEVLTKYEIGLRIAEKYGCDSSLIVPISLNNDTKIFKEKRADCTIMDNSLVKKTLGLSELKMHF